MKSPFSGKIIPPTLQDIEKFDREKHGPATTKLEFVKLHLYQETQKMNSYIQALDTANKNIEYLKKNLADSAELVEELQELESMLEKHNG